ncbi:MAG: TIGR03960 family B12-binding radical SAM protein, partial [Candidatus Aminicenantes bacterium]|nr:TIGR03960 family B12-binding radical SAM protein [Candidatus Aminicenantes bacterium]
MSDGWERILRRVEKPARYTGGEWNARVKDPAAVDIRVALAFPDVYEVGMSYLGQKILYAILNGRPRVQAERVFAPWPDLEAALRAQGLPLLSLETATPLDRFDIVGFSLLYELNATNILTMLDLGRIPLLAAERNPSHPLVIAGGPSAFNPEPLAGIFDFFLIGDGEEAFPEIVDRLAARKASGRDRARLVADMAGIAGVYVPSLYEARPQRASGLQAVAPRAGAPARVEKRIIRGFADSFFPEDIVVPNIQAVFDRVAVEAARGCPQKCRFCQATSIYHPFRAKDPDVLLKTLRNSLRSTGYEDASLSALSLSDYPRLDALIRAAMDALEPETISLSLSSLRPKGLSDEVAGQIAKVRKTGLTLVPEAGTERLRRVINKHLSDAEILDAVRSAFVRGWRLLKLYFMIGLPTEREDDLAGIVDLVRAVVEEGKAVL